MTWLKSRDRDPRWLTTWPRVLFIRKVNFKRAVVKLNYNFYKISESIQFSASTFRQQDFLQKLVSKLSDETGKNEVLSAIESVRNALTSTRNIALHMAMNVDKLVAQIPDVYSPWRESFGNLDVANKKR